LQAIVLVGGEGTRLRPLTYGTPKPMVPIAGIPFLARTMRRLKDAGITDVILPAGYLPEQIREYFGDGSKFGMKITFIVEETPMGTAGALKNVEEHVHGPFVVLNGDVLTSLDLRAMIDEHERKGGIGLLHLIHVEDPSAFGVVLHDANGLISSFIEKPPRETAPSNEVNAGTYLFEREVLDLIPAGRNVSIERETFPLVIERNKGLYAYTTDDYWIDLGKPEQYLQAHRDVLAGRMPLADVPPGPRFIGAGSRIDPSAQLGPAAVVGERSIVEAGARVRDSVLWDEVIIEEGARVEGSILATGVRVGRNAVIEPGSVIGHFTQVGAGETVPRESRLGATAPIVR
jgi:mannose-1-phosphate guanylyltransferase